LGLGWLEAIGPVGVPGVREVRFSVGAADEEATRPQEPASLATRPAFPTPHPPVDARLALEPSHEGGTRPAFPEAFDAAAQGKRICALEGCGHAFAPNPRKPGQEYCSDRCRKAAWRKVRASRA